MISALSGGKNKNRTGKAGSCAGSARMCRPRRITGGRKREGKNEKKKFRRDGPVPAPDRPRYAARVNMPGRPEDTEIDTPHG